MVYVTIPKQEYDKMLEAVKEKKPPSLMLVIHEYKYGCEHNEKIAFYGDDTEFGNKIKDVGLVIEKNYRTELSELQYKISKIEKRWWYKLFNYFY